MELLEFLIKAKLATYASGGEGGERQLPDGTREMTFAADELSYRDRYFGFNPFIGEEVVFRDSKVIWAMNYYGRLTGEVDNAMEVYKFLQKAMRLVNAERPFRGPRQFKENDFEYNDESNGSLDDFLGVERIFYQGKEVYRLDYHGGNVK